MLQTLITCNCSWIVVLFHWVSPPNNVQLLTESFSVKGKDLQKPWTALSSLVQIGISHSTLIHRHTQYMLYTCRALTQINLAYFQTCTDFEFYYSNNIKEKKKNSRNHGNKNKSKSLFWSIAPEKWPVD